MPFDLLLVAIWVMLPVYAANNCATLLGGGRPLDGGRLFLDGRRILGDNKTVKGFVLGALGGVIVGVVQAVIAPALTPYLTGLAPSYPFLAMPPAAVIALPLGALTGDAAKSFVKRRLGIASGARWPVADQLDFVLGAWILCLAASPAWFFACFTLPVMAIAAIMTFPLQYFHNMVAVALGKKDVPW